MSTKSIPKIKSQSPNSIPRWSTPRNVLNRNQRSRVIAPAGTASRTKNAHLRETDINVIMRNARRDGFIQYANDPANQKFGDFTTVTDYHDACNRVIAADEAFASLSAKLRKRFNNDPAQFISFVSDPANLDEMYDLGLAERPAPPRGDLPGQHGAPVDNNPAPSGATASADQPTGGS